jgi:Rad3-related DNA helicase
MKHASIAAFHLVESFLLCLTDARDDGRVLLSIEDGPSTSPASTPIVTLKYILLNPAERFKEVVDSARSVILAGGTMEPVRSPFPFRRSLRAESRYIHRSAISCYSYSRHYRRIGLLPCLARMSYRNRIYLLR